MNNSGELSVLLRLSLFRQLCSAMSKCPSFEEGFCDSVMCRLCKDRSKSTYLKLVIYEYNKQKDECPSCLGCYLMDDGGTLNFLYAERCNVCGGTGFFQEVMERQETTCSKKECYNGAD